MERLWSRAWVYACHASQLPKEGDYVTVDIAGKPLIVLRQGDGSIRALVNRCAHKGSKLVGEPAGSAGKTLRCPYHAWSYRLDGTILNIPLREGYEGTRLSETEACRGLAAIGNPAAGRRATMTGHRCALFSENRTPCLAPGAPARCRLQ